VHTDEDWMKLAFAEANKGLREAGGAEVGCVIVKDGRVLQTSHNEVELRNDPTAHAEMVGIRELCAKFRIPHLKGCTLYCTLQPCRMCSLACVWAGIQVDPLSPRQSASPFHSGPKSESFCPDPWRIYSAPSRTFTLIALNSVVP
jgi:Cytidine and deoxycytidylate deaminase zinc-binding region